MKKIINKKDLLTLLIECFTITLGTFVLALGFRIFLTPHNIVPGGFMGLAQIIYDLCKMINFSAIPVSVWYIILNIFLFIFSVKFLGFKFGLRAGVGILTYSVFVDIVSSMELVDIINNQFIKESANIDGAGVYILYAIYGGVIMGVGTGLVFRGNGSTGGCDMVAVIVNKFFPNVTTGQIVMVMNGIVVFLSAVVYQSLILPLFALVTIFISSKISDIFVDGIKSVRAYYILTNNKENLSNEILTKLKRGVTDIKAEGMFTKESKDMLLVLIKRSEVNQLKQIIKNIDPEAFMFSASVKEAYGKGFVELKKDKQKHAKQNEEIKNPKNVVSEESTENSVKTE